MLRLVRLILALPLIILLVNFASYTYALAARGTYPWTLSASGWPVVLTAYGGYLTGIVLRLDLGYLPVGANASIGAALLDAAGASLGLALLAFSLSLGLGLLLGVYAVRLPSGRLARWLLPLSTLGQSLPSFYVASLAILVGLAFVVRGGETPVPIQGFGWDLHLVLPTLALMVRPTVQVATLTAGLLAEELGKPYIVAARSRGNNWSRLRWRHALRNVLAPVALVVTGSLRLLVGELILVERLFNWPGLGRLLALTLIPSGQTNRPDAAYFLHAPTLAALLTAFVLFFVLADLVATLAAQRLDPRLRISESA